MVSVRRAWSASRSFQVVPSTKLQGRLAVQASREVGTRGHDYGCSRRRRPGWCSREGGWQRKGPSSRRQHVQAGRTATQSPGTERHVTFAGVEDGPSSHAPAEDPAATPRAGALRKRGDQLSVVETPLRKDRIKEEPISVDSDVEVVRERKSKKKKKPAAVGETLALISPDKERQTREEETNGEESVRRPRQEAESEEEEAKQRREFARGFERRLVEPVAATSSQKEVDERTRIGLQDAGCPGSRAASSRGLGPGPCAGWPCDGVQGQNAHVLPTGVEAVVGSEEQGCKRASHAGESPPHILLAAMRHKGGWQRILGPVSKLAIGLASRLKAKRKGQGPKRKGKERKSQRKRRKRNLGAMAQHGKGQTRDKPAKADG